MTGPSSPLELLERWELFGGTWRLGPPSPPGITVVLCTCDGNPVDEIRSDDRDLVRHVESRLDYREPNGGS